MHLVDAQLAELADFTLGGICERKISVAADACSIVDSCPKPDLVDFRQSARFRIRIRLRTTISARCSR